MKQVFYLGNGLKKVIESAELVVNVVQEVAKIDVFHPTISEEAVKVRMDTCKSCDQFEPIQERCKSCGCFMRAKTSLRTSTCPLNKWKAE